VTTARLIQAEYSLTYTMNVQGKIIVITGSAQGLGKAFARRLLAGGARVCISDIQDEVGLQTCQELGMEFGKENLHFIRCDVTKEDDLTALYDGAEKHFGGSVDIFCNNAGINHTAGWKKCMEIDIMAVMTGTYLAMQRMSKKNGGSGGLIINTASAAGIIFADGTKELQDAESYFIAKHGVVALTRSLASESVLSETGVSVRCICPSFADTNIIREGIENVEEARKKIVKEYGLMQPEYVAEAYYSLITECSNGDALVVAKDANFIIYPNFTIPLLNLLAVGSRLFGTRVFRPWHQVLFIIILLLCFHFFLGFILSFVF